MEPVSITAVAAAITTIFFTKTIEKTGDNLGEFLSNKTKLLVSKLSSKSTRLRGLLESNDKPPVENGEAILEVKTIAEQDPEIAKEIRAIESAVQEEPNTKFQSGIQQVKQEASELFGQQSNIQNLTKLAEKIAVLNQGYIETQNNTFNNF